MKRLSSRPRNVYIGLVSLTVLSLLFVSDFVREMLSVRSVWALVVIAAFVKSRLVVLEFMELRAAKPLRRAFDTWLTVVCVACLVLMFR